MLSGQQEDLNTLMAAGRQTPTSWHAVLVGGIMGEITGCLPCSQLQTNDNGVHLKHFSTVVEGL